MAHDIRILVGTTKGAFILHGKRGGGWRVSGPFCDGWPINHVIGDPDTGTIWAAGGSEWTGAGVWRSDDGGATWDLSLLSNGKFDTWLTDDPDFAAHVGQQPRPPAPFTGNVDAIWSLGLAGGRLLAGAKPAQLYASSDQGTTWTRIDALNDHPSAPGWNPGAAGLVLHSIVVDPGHPKRMWVGISAAGVFASEDGGASWDRQNRLTNEDAASHHGHSHPGSQGHEVGHCVHNMVRAGADGDLLYQQNHHGVFRSQDGGQNWHDITGGLPSTFGFPIAVHPHDPQTIWVFPLNGDTKGRFPPEASAAVWRSRDGGQNWQKLQHGLPGTSCFFTVLRQAMATDRARQAGVYFGTNTGSVFASHDEGDHWDEIARHMPTILSIETLVSS